MSKCLSAFITLLVALALFHTQGRAAEVVIADNNNVRLDLSGTWRFTTTDNLAYADPNTPTTGAEWRDITAPQEFSAAGYGSYDGYAWYKKQFEVPAAFADVNLIAVMGFIDDVDEVYFNGVKIGMTGSFPPNFVSDYFTLRQYTLPSSLNINYGGINTIAIRMYDGTGGGGLFRGPLGLFSKGALREELGFFFESASPEQTTRVQTLLGTQKQTLQNKDITGFLQTIDAGYVHDGRDKARLTADLTGYASQYASLVLVDEQVEVLRQGDTIIVDTTRSLLGDKGDGSAPTVLVPRQTSYRYYSEQVGNLLEVGNRSRFFEDFFFSPKMGETRFLTVYLPPSYFLPENATRQYPTVYLLHGFNGRHREWFLRAIDDVIDQLIARGVMDEMIVIMPDANNSWYIDSPIPPNSARPYQSMIIEDMVPFVDRTFRTIPNRQHRGVSDVSMGGFGAFQLGLKHPTVFSSIASHMGALNFPPFSPECSASRDPLVQAYCQGQNPSAFTVPIAPDELKRHAFYFDSGTEDDFGFYAGVASIHNQFVGKLVPHECVLGPGKHNDDFWVPKLERSFAMHTRNFKAPQGGTQSVPATCEIVPAATATATARPSTTSTPVATTATTGPIPPTTQPMVTSTATTAATPAATRSPQSNQLYLPFVRR